MLRVLAVAILLLSGGCSSTSPPRPDLRAFDLLSADNFDGAVTLSIPIPPDEVFALDDEMRAFVRTHVASTRSSQARLRRLLEGMQSHGLFDLIYAQDVTRTARETFHQRRGNCLSFTILFVALAREAGLRAHYQMVSMPPVWSNNDDVIVVSNHINVIVRTGTEGNFTVDFNLVESRGSYPQRQVDDDYALALFYMNQGAERLIAGDASASFTLLKAAIETSPGIPGPWSNLGMLYARHGLHRHAEAAYLQALAASPQNPTVMTNLTSLYQQTGDNELAEAYRRRIRAYQQRNPYFHYALAQQAYVNGEFDHTLERLQSALRLNRNEHQFHFLRALALHQLGEPAEAEKSLARARQHAELPEIRERYEAPIGALARSWAGDRP
jgi:Flp pilus assembly protein TadD